MEAGEDMKDIYEESAYSIVSLALKFGVHRNTMRAWINGGPSANKNQAKVEQLKIMLQSMDTRHRNKSNSLMRWGLARRGMR